MDEETQQPKELGGQWSPLPQGVSLIPELQEAQDGKPGLYMQQAAVLQAFVVTPERPNREVSSAGATGFLPVCTSSLDPKAADSLVQVRAPSPVTLWAEQVQQERSSHEINFFPKILLFLSPVPFARGEQRRTPVSTIPGLL